MTGFPGYYFHLAKASLLGAGSFVFAVAMETRTKTVVGLFDTFEGGYWPDYLLAWQIASRSATLCKLK
tara:strand:- start:495 stop:698 length:204 start_codon:yes stop_codon:yes gene_type:complete